MKHAISLLASPAVQLRSLTLILALVLTGTALSAQSHSLVSFDAPDATTGTFPMKINSAGQITGSYQSNVAHGFVRNSDGSLIEFDVPNLRDTYAVWINSKGQIVGYGDSSQWPLPYRGFFRSASGSFAQINYPGAKDTFALSINDSGVIAGQYDDSNGVYHGFVRSASGVYTAFDVAGAGTANGQGTQLGAINNSGEIAGVYLDSSFASHGFVRDATGTITTFDVPSGTSTTPAAINNNGDVTGTYSDGVRVIAFIRHADGTFTTFAAPGAASTFTKSINDGEYVCGVAFSAHNAEKTFLRDPSGKVIQQLDNNTAQCLDVNNRVFSIGTYSDSGVTHGWVK